MALDKTTLKSSLKTGIIAAFTANIPGGLSDDQEAAFDSTADALATTISDAVDVFVKSGTVTIEPGIPVSTTGTAAAQTGTTTDEGTGTIS